MIDRPPLREGKIFLDYSDRRTVSDNLETAYVALNRAFRGIWLEKSSEHGQFRHARLSSSANWRVPPVSGEQQSTAST